MNMRPTPVITGELDPQPVDFELIEPIAPDLVSGRGAYTNEHDQRFVLTITAPTRDETAMVEFGRDLRVWLLAVVPPYPFAEADEEQGQQGAPPPEDEEAAPPTLEELVREGESEGDQPVVGLSVDCVQVLDAGTAFAMFSSFAVRKIDKDERHCFESGPERVIASLLTGAVKLGGLTYPPKVIALPPSPRNRHANGQCWVKGVAAESKYTLNAGWTKKPCG
jgi:hypothetical protein